MSAPEQFHNPTRVDAAEALDDGHEQVPIDTVEGLEKLRESAEELVEEIHTIHEGITVNAESESLINSATTEANDLNRLLDKCVLKVESEHEITDEDLEKLQYFYDALIAVRDKSLGMLEVESSAPTATEVPPAAEVESSIRSLPVTVIEAPSIVAVEPVVEVPSNEPTDVSTTWGEHVPEIIPPAIPAAVNEKEVVRDIEIDVYRKTVRNELARFLEGVGETPTQIEKRLKKSIDEAHTIADIDRIASNITSVFEAIPVKERLKVVLGETVALLETLKRERAEINTFHFSPEHSAAATIDIKEYDASLARLSTVVEQLETALQSKEDASVAANTVERYVRVREEVVQNIRTITEVLKSFSNEAAAEESEIELLGRDGIVEKMIEEPLEFNLTALLERTAHMSSVTAEEKETIKAMQQNFERLKREDASEAKQIQAFQNLEAFIDHVQEYHQLDELQIEASKLVMSMEESSSEQLETARAMRENFIRLIKEGVPKEKIIQAYENLKQFVTHYHEESAKKVEAAPTIDILFGMRIPHAGPAGVFGARAFREGLLLVRDRHRGLMDAPEKVALVDRIISKLGRVPNAGLSEDEVREISSLAEQIGITAGIVGNFSKPETYVVPATSPVEAIETEEIQVEPVLPTTKRGAMTLQAEDAEHPTPVTIKRVVPLSAPVFEGVEPTADALPEDKPVERIELAEVTTPVKAIVDTSYQDIAESRRTHPKTSSALEFPIRNTGPRQESKQTVVKKEVATNSEALNELIEKLYGSHEKFLKRFTAFVHSVEDKTYDAFDKKFEAYKSPFLFLKDMKVSEFHAFLKKDIDERKTLCSTHQTKYETLVAWNDLLLDIFADYNADEIASRSVGELVMEWLTTVDAEAIN